MTLSDAETLARFVESRQYERGPEALDLARFVLAVMPVLRAAENCLPDPDPESRRYAVFADVKDHACSVCAPGNDFPDKTWRCARHELIHAVDQLRRELETK